MSPSLAGSAGPHVFVEDLDVPTIQPDDVSHLERSLRMRKGDPLTVSDGRGSWAYAKYSPGQLTLDGPVVHEDQAPWQLTVGFSLVKGSKPEVVIQKLTELGVDHIVVLDAERTIVRWDDAKVASAHERWARILREAAMQSHRVRMPTLAGLEPAKDFLARAGVARADFGNTPIDATHRTIAIGPEGGWSPEEREASSLSVSLGNTVLRAETAAIAAGVSMVAARDRAVRPSLG